jgi:hypothetical protein
MAFGVSAKAASEVAGEIAKFLKEQGLKPPTG